MKLTRANIAIYIVVLTLMFLSGCKSKKDTLDTTGTLVKKPMKTLVEDVLNKELKYQTIESKGKIEIRKGSSSMKTTAVFKLVKDSIIQASIRIPLIGGEAMRISFTPKEVLIIDRMQKQYALVPYNELKSLGQSNSVFYNIQSLFTNKLFILGENDVDRNDYNKFALSATPDMYMLQPKDSKNSLSLNFAVDATDHIVSTLMYDKDKDLTVQWSYNDFVIDNDQKSVYPTIMDVKVGLDKRRIDMGIECPKYDINNKSFKIDNSIPSKYSEVNIMDIISNYLNKIK